jgi:hypothetical protein
MITATGCCAARWNATPGCGRKRRDQEDGLPVEPAQADGRAGHVRHQRPGVARR